ncbi:MAG: hypothetical protein O7F69_03335 [Alphaproteobacteria bacterium]|nr:hypothetical protein [Alphaproteobacteria bacterium]
MPNFSKDQGNSMPLPSKVPNKAVKAGDKLVLIGPSGGGYGNPFERDSLQVVEDVRDGYLSVDSARSDYGVVVTPALELDAAATEALRQDLHPN